MNTPSFSEQKDELKHISLAQIRVNPYQPRRDFNGEELEELAQSIRTVGLLHPPLVRPLPDSSLYELISGERRFRAAQLASLTTIPVYIRHTGYAVSAQAALILSVASSIVGSFFSGVLNNIFWKSVCTSSC